MMKMKIMLLSLRRGLAHSACTVHTEVGFALDVVAQPLDLAALEDVDVVMGLPLIQDDVSLLAWAGVTSEPCANLLEALDLKLGEERLESRVGGPVEEGTGAEKLECCLLVYCAVCHGCQERATCSRGHQGVVLWGETLKFGRFCVCMPSCGRASRSMRLTNKLLCARVDERDDAVENHKRADQLPRAHTQRRRRNNRRDARRPHRQLALVLQKARQSRL